jgi:hypothetical protein
MVQGIWDPTILAYASDIEVMTAYRVQQEWTKRFGRHPTEVARAELRGKTLCCWCPIDQPCHADILLELTNPGGNHG